MKEIYHCFWVNTASDVIFRALTDKNGLAAWWTKNLDHQGTIGSISTFRFKSGVFNKMKISHIDPKLIEWKCVDGHDEWIGSQIKFEISDQGKRTKICFSHFGFKEQSQYIAECNFMWAKYLVSLQKFCESGKGLPNEG